VARPRAQFPDLIRQLRHNLGEAVPFRRRHPLDPQSFCLNAHKIQNAVYESVPSTRVVVSIAIVAIARMAARHQHAIGPFLERPQDV
jgi:hypothetical protein